jgi:CDP-diglyceride synthetase
MNLEPCFSILILLTAANGAPLFAKKLFGDVFAIPLDGGALFFDRRPILGRSKTIRGAVAGMLTAALIAPFLGLSWQTGLAIGPATMAGDIVSSFAKRRLGLAPSSRAVGLDQIPESLFPALAAMPLVGLTLIDVALVTAVFTVGSLALSVVLYRLRLRDEPY